VANLLTKTSNTEKIVSQEGEPIPIHKGLDFDACRKLFARYNDQSISPDDPICMIATLLNAYITEIEKLHSNFKEAEIIVLTDHTNLYINELKNFTKNLENILKDPTIDKIKDIFSENDKILQNHTKDMKWCSFIIVISLIFNLCFFIFK
jgi:hypothetical protein